MRTQLLALAVAGVALSGAPSYAAMCAGTAATARVCVNRDVSVTPTGGPVSYSDCVVVGDPENCIPVGVTTPNVVVTGSGSVATAECNVCVSTLWPLVSQIEATVSQIEALPQRCGEAFREWGDDFLDGGTPLPTSRVGECVRGD